MSKNGWTPDAAQKYREQCALTPVRERAAENTPDQEIWWDYCDKTRWRAGHGVWDDEADKIQFVDATTGFDCLIVRVPHTGSLCGYVGVSEAHPLFGKEYDFCPISCGALYCEHCPDHVLNAPGGITFSNFCQEHDNGLPEVCHVAQTGRPERAYWFGFDCAHAGDLMPAIGRIHEGDRYKDVYRDANKVHVGCANLAVELQNYERTVKARNG